MEAFGGAQLQSHSGNIVLLFAAALWSVGDEKGRMILREDSGCASHANSEILLDTVARRHQDGRFGGCLHQTASDSNFARSANSRSFAFLSPLIHLF